MKLYKQLRSEVSSSYLNSSCKSESKRASSSCASIEYRTIAAHNANAPHMSTIRVPHKSTNVSPIGSLFSDCIEL